MQKKLNAPSVSRVGFEPTTKSLKGSCSTAELPAHVNHYISASVILTSINEKYKLMLDQLLAYLP